MTVSVLRLRSWVVVVTLYLGSLLPAHAQDPTATATNLCAIAVGIFTNSQYNAHQVLGAEPLQIAMEQTGGSGIYPELQALGPATTFFIDNPHFDDHDYLGQLFHFTCTSQHQATVVNWDLKFAASTGKIEDYSFEFKRPQAPAQQTQQQQPSPNQQVPQQQVPQQQAPQQQTQHAPQQPAASSGPQPAPDRAEACQMFPGMC